MEADSYALNVASSSFEWYRRAAIRARRLYRASEFGIIIVSALVPLSTVAAPGISVIPALLGSLVVVITGLRSVFHWQENYLRFSRAREAVEAERRRYHTGGAPYSNNATRDVLLVEAITRIEQDEMGKWLQLAAPSRGDHSDQEA